ncbi:MAG: thioredoxin family protein [Candidatus Heimdallarchaeota archaeon]|nr:thioredoxin family protein [Candidatus Heimdallarchaeota archaeon]
MDRKTLINHLFDHGISYNDYIQTSNKKEHLELGWETTTNELSKLDAIEKGKVNYPLKIIVVSEHWCGDCVKGVPVISRMAEEFDQWQLRIVKRDDFLTLIEPHYTVAGRFKIPIIIFADEDGDEVERWIERPANSYQLIHELQDMRLNKEDYITQYRTIEEINLPGVTRVIFKDLLFYARKCVDILAILPKKKVQS